MIRLKWILSATVIMLNTGCLTASQGWVQSYKAGYADNSGRYCGGSEIMHIVSHNGKLYAFNGYWKDRNFGKHSAQVLRLDSPDAKWQVDLETTAAGLKYERGAVRHMKGNILKSVTFKTDGQGRKVHVNLLVAAAWAFDSNKKGHQAVSFFQRDDSSRKWSHSVLLEGPRDVKGAGGETAKIRRVPRDIEVYHDPVTGVDRIFMLAGDPGILSGVYDSETGRIKWDAEPEYLTEGSVLSVRPLGLAQANGALFFSAGGSIYKRKNGATPEWTSVLEIDGRVNTDVGGIRGLTALPGDTGQSDSLIFVWTPRGRSEGDILKWDGKETRKETTLRRLWEQAKIPGTGTPLSHIGGYNTLFPVKDPRTGEMVHLVGFQTKLSGAKEDLVWTGYYKGGLYGVRIAADKYRVGEVNGRYDKTKPVLVAPRAFALSPFKDESNVVYVGGYDANFRDSDSTAWIFKADADTVIYGKRQPSLPR